MLKIYNPGRHIGDVFLKDYHQNFIPFDIECQDWEYVTDITKADIIAIQGHGLFPEINLLQKIIEIKGANLRPDQKLLFLHIFHIDNVFSDTTYYNYIRRTLEQEIPNEFAIIHPNLDQHRELFYDFLWNRQKIYFTEYDKIDLKGRLYTHSSDEVSFRLNPIEKKGDMKKFLCPNRIYNFKHLRLEYRKKIASFLEPYIDQGYISDPLNGKILDAENPSTNKFLPEGGWLPVANRYYENTYFSLYCETLTGNLHKDNPYKSITEKTWDPLIKGHFILPFGYQGIIDHIKSYGFLFPDWIDYTYDYIEDNDQRFQAFLESAKKLLELPIERLQELYVKDRDILVHNRQVFWDRPYDSLHDKVIKFFDIGN